ncbi:MAG: GtrA family protein [Bacteroidales bacterium]|nr:GtrA family protein [Clostridium sp.]MCM1202895.1 GtrA family protein [Bacteroidales bacterium]
MEKCMELLKKYHEMIAYLFWGVMSTIVSWGSYSIFALLLKNLTSEILLFGIGMSMTVAVSNLLSWVCAVAFAFVTNKLWVFQSRSWKKNVFLPELGKFLSARIITGVMEIVLVPLLVSLGLSQTIFGIEGIVAKILVSVLVVILNYVFSKLFIFK